MGNRRTEVAPGRILLFKESSIWEQYKWRAVTVVSLCILEAVLIVGLLINRNRRRKAEEETARFAARVEAEHERLEEVARNVPGIVWESRIQPGGNTQEGLFVSPYVERMLGYTVEEWLNTPDFALSILLEEDREECSREIARLLESGKEGLLRFRWRANDGRVLWVEAHLAVMRDESGKTVGLRGVAMDISERKQAEEAGDNLAAIVESSDSAISSETLEGTIISWNPAAENMYGYSASDMAGQHVSRLAPDDLKGEVLGILERISVGECMDHLETVRSTKEGSRIEVSLTISPIKDAHGMVVGVSTIARDITARKQADQELGESEERFRTMADAAPVMVWTSGPDTLCTFFNRPWLEFTGRTMEQELGNGWAEGIHPEDYQRCLDVYLSAFEARSGFTMEYRLRRADGEYRWIVDTGVPRLLPNGDLAGYVGSCLDISERKRHEMALQQLTGRLFLLQDEERKRVAAELHDGLGQSLAIIKNRAIIGLRDPTNQELVMEQLEEIAATATATILEVREIAHNLRPYELDRLGLVAAIKSMIERVSDSTSIDLSADLEPIDGLLSPEAETSIYRIVQEGINNVVKHSHATAALIEIRKTGRHLAISIQDDGKGISTSGKAENRQNGHGFGLAGIAERVRALGGSFAIDSQPTRGTRLTVRLEFPNGNRE